MKSQGDDMHNIKERFGYWFRDVPLTDIISDVVADFIAIFTKNETHDRVARQLVRWR